MGVETVTILFTDVVRSTETASGLDRETADEIRRGHFEVLRSTIDEFAGREVKNLGDGVMAAFTSVGSAVACAVAMQQRVEHRARRAEVAVAMRVGISFGDATAEEDDFFGTPVVEAARLCSEAQPGQILAHDFVRRLVGPGGPELRALGDRELRGLAEPVPTAEVVWQPLDDDRGLSILPSRLAPVAGEGFHGRDEELAQLEQALDEALGGTRRTALIGGEPGIGKTRLCTEVALRGCARGATVLYGRSEEGLGVPYQPVLEAMRHLVAHAPDELLCEHVARSGGDLVRLVPELAQRVPEATPRVGLDGEAERYALFAAVEALLGAAATERPVVLVLDDLHWADPSTILLLRHVLTSPTDAPVLALLTYRTSEVPAEHPLNALRADLHRSGGCDAVELRGLRPADLEGLLEVLGGRRLEAEDREFVETLHRETNGNPFFARELLRHLVESGQIVHTGGRWRATSEPAALDLPGSVRDVLSHRLAHLGNAATDLLATAAVIGRDFEVDVLEHASGYGIDELLDVLDAAVEARLLVESGGERPGYAFAHALVGHTLYSSLSAARRCRRHQQVAEALEQVHGGGSEDVGSRVGELAHHWLHAGPSHRHKALRLAVAAAERATAQLAPQEAARWYARALEAFDDAGEDDASRRCDLLTSLGVAERDSGDPGHRETLLQAARIAEAEGEDDPLIRAALANSRGFVSASGAVDTERVSVLEAALSAVGDGDSVERTLLLATLATELAFAPGELERRRALSDEALAAARRLGDPLTLARVTSMRFAPLLRADTFAERLANTQEGIAAAERAGDPVSLCRNLHWHAFSLVEAGRVEEARATHARTSALVGELREPTLQWQTAYDSANFALIAGRLEEADTLATEALQMGMASGQPDAMPFYAAQVTCIRFDQGRLAELQPLLLQTVEQNPGIPAFRSGLALASVESGHDDKARELLLAEAADGFGSLPLDVAWLPGLCIYALVCSAVDDAGVAPLLRDRIAPFTDLVIYSGVSWWGTGGHHAGNLDRVLGDHDRAVARIARAVEVYERMDAPTWLERGRRDLARAQQAAAVV